MVVSRASSIRKPAKRPEDSLAGRHPELLQEWDYERNPFSPYEPVPGSTVMAHWRCKEGHEYQKQIAKRVQGSGCPYCRKSKAILLVGFNDLETMYPELAQEWHPVKNDKPAGETRSSEARYLSWWRCADGHEWKATVFNRTRNNSGCPECSIKTSKGELELLDFVRELGYEAKYTDRTIIAPYELDIWIPELRIGLEFNGIYWHSDKLVRERCAMGAEEYHRRKHELALNADAELGFIWQDDWVLRPEETRDAVKRMLCGEDVPSLRVYEKAYSLELLKEIQAARS